MSVPHFDVSHILYVARSCVIYGVSIGLCAVVKLSFVPVQPPKPHDGSSNVIRHFARLTAEEESSVIIFVS